MSIKRSEQLSGFARFDFDDNRFGFQFFRQFYGFGFFGGFSFFLGSLGNIDAVNLRGGGNGGKSVFDEEVSAVSVAYFDNVVFFCPDL